jgi:branched-chain amino acid transport system permease protein
MSRKHCAALAIGLVAIAVLPNFLKSYGVYLMTLFCVYLMATMGLNLTVGYAGQMSLGHAAFFGIGAYHAAILMKLGWPLLAVLAGRRGRLLSPSGLAVGFPCAARAAPLPRVRDARLQRARLPRDAERAES